MVKRMTACGGSGLQDWLLQRITAIIIAAYFIILTGFCISHSNGDYATWKGFCALPFMRFLNVLAVMSVIVHAWIGVWTIITDYVDHWFVRLSIQILVFLLLLLECLWAIKIVWDL